MYRRMRLSGPLLVLLLCAAASYGQSWTGKGRAHGQVVDEQGKPVADASVSLRPADSPEEGPEPVLTNEKGRWALGGLGGGTWTVLIEAEGYLISQGTCSVNPFQPAQAVKVVLTRSPTSSIEKGDGFFEAGDFAGARAEYQEAISAMDESGQARVRSRIGDTYMMEGDFEAARREYEAALPQIPSEEQTHLRLQIANSYQRQDNVAAARAQYEAVLPSLGPEGQAEVLQSIALGYGMEANNSQAIATLEKAHQLAPEDIDILQLLADLLMREGRHEEAQQYLARLPDDAALPADMVLNMGIRFYNEGNMEEALGHFERAVRDNPDEPETYYYRGLVYLSQGRNEEAKGDFHKFLALDPDSTHKSEIEEFLAFLEQGG